MTLVSHRGQLNPSQVPFTRNPFPFNDQSLLRLARPPVSAGARCLIRGERHWAQVEQFDRVQFANLKVALDPPFLALDSAAAR